MSEPFDLKQKAQKLDKLLNGGVLIRILGNSARNFFVQSWRNQGFTDNELVKWKHRKADEMNPKTKAYKQSQGRAIGIKTGDLRRSVRILRAGRQYVEVGSDLDYAEYFNGGVPSRNQVARPFVGASNTLDAIMLKEIDVAIMNILG